MNEIDRIERCIHDRLLVAPQPRGRSRPLGRDDDLLEALDSLEILRLIAHVEDEYGIEIDGSEVSAENLGTIARFASYVGTKRGAAT
jgi:hypothetical protein